MLYDLSGIVTIEACAIRKCDLSVNRKHALDNYRWEWKNAVNALAACTSIWLCPYLSNPWEVWVVASISWIVHPVCKELILLCCNTCTCWCWIWQNIINWLKIANSKNSILDWDIADRTWETTRGSDLWRVLSSKEVVSIASITNYCLEKWHILCQVRESGI